MAIVAFVGRSALSYLPKPKGIELYCWPAAGGTSSKAIRELARRGVAVQFAEQVHIKLYWAKGGDAVITSANLGDNALGAGGLHEMGVLVPARSVQIDRLIRQIRPVAVTQARLAKLAASEAKRKGFGRAARGGGAEVPSFEEWATSSPRKAWKWGYFTHYVGSGHSRRSLAVAQAMSPGRQPEHCLTCRRGQYSEGDWILEVRLLPSGRLTRPQWVFVNQVVLVGKQDRRHYDKNWPFEVVQVVPLSQCPPPPFKIDAHFRKALAIATSAMKHDDVEKHVDAHRPTPSFLKSILSGYSG